MKKLFKKRIILIIILIIITILLIFVPKNSSYEESYVIRVIDGDTFVLENNLSVRLICIDTPELGKNGSYEAKQFLENLVLNKTVKLEKDISEIDKYGRLLRYVYVGNIFVNKEIVKQNYGEVFEFEPDIRRCDEIRN